MGRLCTVAHWRRCTNHNHYLNDNHNNSTAINLLGFAKQPSATNKLNDDPHVNNKHVDNHYVNNNSELLMLTFLGT
jgi:hypothetical protein